MESQVSRERKTTEEGLDQMVEEVAGLEKESGLRPTAMGTFDGSARENGPQRDPEVPSNSCRARTMLHMRRELRGLGRDSQPREQVSRYPRP